MSRRPAIVTCLLLLGCNDNGTLTFLDSGPPDAGIDTQCGPNLRPYKTACIPLLDDCPENHVAVPGGGCKRVGVEQCEIDGIPGIKGPPDWTCKRIGVVECEIDGGPGLRGPPDWTCTPIGPPRTSCLPGWAVTDKDGWCEPILPDAECTGATMARIGHATCQPVGDCGSGTWGNITLTPATVYVDATSEDGDGSKAKPYATITQALAVVKSGGHIALAAGTYAENVVIETAVTLEGRCADKVLVQGSGDPAGVTVKGRGVVLRGLSVTAERVGVELQNGGELRLEQVIVADCGEGGVVAVEGGEATVKDSLIADNTSYGIHALDAGLTVEAAQVRETKSATDEEGGFKEGGFGVFVASTSGAARLELRRSVVSANTVAGVMLAGATGSIEQTVVRSTVTADEGSPGYGVCAAPSIDRTGPGYGGISSALALRDCVLAENRGFGLYLLGSRATLTRTIVRDTRDDKRTTTDDGGVLVERTDDLPAAATVRDSAVVRSKGIGFELAGGSLTMERTEVRDTFPREFDNRYGWGLLAGAWRSGPASVQTFQCLVDRSSYFGVDVLGSSATLEQTIVRNTSETEAGEGGIGVHVQPHSAKIPAELVLRDAQVSHNHRGVNVTPEASASVERTVIREHTPGTGLFGCGLTVYQNATASVQDTILWGNSYTGIYVDGARATLGRTVIAATRPHPVYGDGRGVHFALDADDLDFPAGLWMADCLVADNHLVGVGAFGAELTVRRTVVRDTRNAPINDPQGNELVAAIGNGIKAAEYGDRRGTLLFEDTVVARNHGAGMLVAMCDATIRRCRVVDTGAGAKGLDGRGVSLADGSYVVEDSQISGNRVVGLGLFSASARVRRCQVGSTAEGLLEVIPTGKQEAEVMEGFGAGVAAAPPTNASSGPVTVRDCLVQDSGLAGLWFGRGAAAVQRSVVRRGELSVLLDGGATVDIAPDNVFEDNTENRVTYGEGIHGLAPLKVPPAPQSPGM